VNIGERFDNLIVFADTPGSPAILNMVDFTGINVIIGALLQAFCGIDMPEIHRMGRRSPPPIVDTRFQEEGLYHGVYQH